MIWVGIGLILLIAAIAGTWATLISLGKRDK